MPAKFFDPNSQDAINAKRKADAERKQAEVAGREKLLADAADPGGDHPNVLVVKRDEKAAKAEQQRLDIAKAAGAKQERLKNPPLPPEKGKLPAEFVPAHPVEPDATGSSPHDPKTPAGPMDEDVIHVTGDIAPDGTPLVSPGFVEPTPEWDGESDRDYSALTKLGRVWRHGPAEQAGATNEKGELEPVYNSHSPEGAALDAIKLGRPVVYVPNDATLDPVSHRPDRRV